VTAIGAFLLLWYRRLVVIKGAVGVVLAVRKLFKRRPFMDIASLKGLVSVGAALGSVAGATMEDGKVDVKDLALLPRLIPVFPDLLAIDFSQVVPEAKDLSEAEAAELVALYKAEFDIPQDDVEVKIETVLSLCVRLAGIVAELIAAFKKPVA
jgi:hypothetical protein